MRFSFARVEAACANVVERAFATAFPSALEPVQIARKLVAAFESGAVAETRAGRVFTVRLSQRDRARFEGELPYLERQWTMMLVRLARRSHKPQREPVVRAVVDPAVAYGTVAIGIEARPAARTLVLGVRRGIPRNAVVALDRTLVIGRDAACDLVLADPRVSRRHLEISSGDGLRFRDLGSANGTSLNGTRVQDGALACGDVLALGDCELGIDAIDDGDRP